MSVAEPFGLGEAQRFELRELAAAAGRRSRRAPSSASTSRASSPAATRDDRVRPLLIAAGAEPQARGPRRVDLPRAGRHRQRRRAAREARGRRDLPACVRRPGGSRLDLPAYELALMTAAHVSPLAALDVELLLVTPEHEPLVLFGPAASDAIESCWRSAGSRSAPALRDAFADGELGWVPTARSPSTRRSPFHGSAAPHQRHPADCRGFIPVDSHALVVGCGRLRRRRHHELPGQAGRHRGAAGRGRGDVDRHRGRRRRRAARLPPGSARCPADRPSPRYLRARSPAASARPRPSATEPLWWPPAKIVGRYLAPFLGAFAGVEAPPAAAPRLGRSRSRSSSSRRTSGPTALPSPCRASGPSTT